MRFRVHIKRRLVVLAGLAALLLLVGISALDTRYAGQTALAQTGPTITVRDANLSIAPGETGTVEVVATGASSLAGIQLVLNYDSTVLSTSQNDVTQGALPAGVLFIANVNDASGTVSIVVAGASAFGTSEVVLGSIKFTAVGSLSQSSELDFTGLVASDERSSALSASATSGKITIGTAAPTQVPATPTSTRPVPATATAVSPTATSPLPTSTAPAAPATATTVPAPVPTSTVAVPSATSPPPQPTSTPPPDNSSNGDSCNAPLHSGDGPLTVGGGFVLTSLFLVGLLLRRGLQRSPGRQSQSSQAPKPTRPGNKDE